MFVVQILYVSAVIIAKELLIGGDMGNDMEWRERGS